MSPGAGSGHNPPMDKIDIDPAVGRYVVPVVVAAAVAGILAAQELEDAGLGWSWRHVGLAVSAGVVLGWAIHGMAAAAGIPAAWDAPLGVVAGSLGIRGLSIGARWLRGHLESILSAMLSKVVPGAADAAKPTTKGGDDAQS